MLPLLLRYPQIDPVLVQIGPFSIRWYALAYIAGILLGWRYIVHLLREKRLWLDTPMKRAPVTETEMDDLVLWLTLGIVIGGRVGYILFYGLVYFANDYLSDPLRVFKIWEGGMSFHGGLTGVLLALFLFCRSKRLSFIAVGDLIAAATPIGLFFGRLANFINGELYGRPSNVPWAMIFPADRAGVPRHPSQIYEASLEGLALFVLLYVMIHRFRSLSRPGLTGGVFLAFYGSARAFCEFFREPENPIGQTGLTMGMMLSLPMWIAAGYLVWYALKTPESHAKPK